MKTYTVGDINPLRVFVHENGIPTQIAVCSTQRYAKLIVKALNDTTNHYAAAKTLRAHKKASKP